MNKQTSIRRPHPAKPVKQTPVEHTKQATSAEALSFLNAFMQEARSEIRKRDRLAMKGNVSKTDCDSVSFYFDNFCLTIDFTKGMVL